MTVFILIVAWGLVLRFLSAVVAVIVLISISYLTFEQQGTENFVAPFVSWRGDLRTLQSVSADLLSLI